MTIQRVRMAGQCPNCGVKNARRNRSCRDCGATLDVRPVPTRSRVRLLIAIVVGLVVAMVVMAGLNILSNDVLSVEAFGPIGLAVGAGVGYLIVRFPAPRRDAGGDGE
ncbi:MAG: hypothetical protein HKN46_02035 [Acidimicrobiia bacterium]|nr:hypothetical protein [Acidimicrobiia bacterium]